jgi:4'-phosphopantetheinyl transferase
MNTDLPALQAIELEPGVIQVIRARLAAPPLPPAELAELLSADERARAAQFLHDADSHRHIIGRGLLRLAVAPLLGEEPGALIVETSPDGKPFIANGPSFSITHSGDDILVAIAPDGRVGIDVEEVYEPRDLLGLARASFRYDELGAIVDLPEAARLHAFFRVWTRKEALLKAIGCGLSGRNSVAVSAAENATNALTLLDHPGEAVGDWVVQSIACPPSTAAATPGVGARAEAAVAWDRPLRAVAMIDVR